MMIDLVMTEFIGRPEPIRLKEGWVMSHKFDDPTYLNVRKEVHAEGDAAMVVSIEFEHDKTSNKMMASFSIDMHTKVTCRFQPKVTMTEELFCVPLPANVAAAICFTKP